MGTWTRGYVCGVDAPAAVEDPVAITPVGECADVIGLGASGAVGCEAATRQRLNWRLRVVVGLLSVIAVVAMATAALTITRHNRPATANAPEPKPVVASTGQSTAPPTIRFPLQRP
jgi:hypothetical protein